MIKEENFKTQTNLDPENFKKAIDFILDKTPAKCEFDFHGSMGRKGYSINGCASAMNYEAPMEVNNLMFNLTKELLKTPEDIENFNQKWLKPYNLKISRSEYDEERIMGRTYRTYGITFLRFK